jgi:hypothetical protein
MANADIDPPVSFLDAHPAYRALVENRALSQAFAKADAEALQAKAWYTRLGVFSLAAAAVTLLLLIAGVTLHWPALEDARARAGIGLLGALGIAAQVALLAGPFKKRWLRARFRAERLRCLKFQAFAEAACAGEGFAAAVADFTARALAQMELHDEDGALREFDPETALGTDPTPHAPLAPPNLAELRDIYRQLRIDYQMTHCAAQIEKLKEERRLPASASEITFWAGVGLGYADAVTGVLRVGEAAQPAMHFLTLALFVASALLFVLERGRSYNAAIERYEDYRLAMSRVGGALSRAGDAVALAACIRDGERAALRELKAFCRETEKSTYLF